MGGGGANEVLPLNRGGGHKSFNTEKEGGGGGVKNVFELKCHV